MAHPSDDDLILYLYGESQRREEIARALAASAEARQRLAALRRLFAAIPVEEPPQLPAAYGERVWRRLRPRLAPAAERPWRWLEVAPRRLAAAAAAAALLVLLVAGFVAGRFLPRSGAAFSDEARGRILAAAVAHHLERTELLLVELDNGPLPADLAGTRRRAEELAESNRFYRQAARQAGEGALAELLERLEPVVVEVAHASWSGDAGDTAAWRRRLEDLDLVFRLRIVGRRLRAGTPPPRPPTPRQDAV